MRWQVAGAPLAIFAFSTLVNGASAADVIVTPAAGSQQETFAVDGQWLQPGMVLALNFTSPAGAVFSAASADRVLSVNPDGTFGFTFVPADEFGGQSVGIWLVQVCISGEGECAETTFQITP